MRILLTGSKGQLGRCFRDRLPDHWELIAADSATLDITDAQAIENMVQSFQPDAIVNAAAYTAIDEAEKENEKAFAANSTAVHNLATAARRFKIRFVHISTDYVFDGESKAPYAETDSPCPKSVYGQSKLAGELLALAANPSSLILRTSAVFSEYGRNFVKTMLKSATDCEEFHIADDQTTAPTYAGDLAQAIIQLLQQSAAPRGIYHFCGNQPATNYELAHAIFQTASTHNPAFKPPKLSHLDSQNSSTLAPRPIYSVLDCHKIQDEFNIQLSDWQKALDTIVPALLSI